MNLVLNASGTILSSIELAAEANKLYTRALFTPADFAGDTNRLKGDHCNCRGNGIFKLLPESDPDVQTSGKRYMQCTFCGCWSHL